MRSARALLFNIADLAGAIALVMLVLVVAVICGIVQGVLVLLDMLLGAAGFAIAVARESWEDRRR